VGPGHLGEVRGVPERRVRRDRLLALPPADVRSGIVGIFATRRMDFWYSASGELSPSSGSSKLDALTIVRSTSIGDAFSLVSFRRSRRSGESARCFVSSALKSRSWSLFGSSPFKRRYATSSYSAFPLRRSSIE